MMPLCGLRSRICHLVFQPDKLKLVQPGRARAKALARVAARASAPATVEASDPATIEIWAGAIREMAAEGRVAVAAAIPIRIASIARAK